MKGRVAAVAPRLAMAFLSACVGLFYLWAWSVSPERPVAPVLTSGWWHNYDQTHYMRSALAFAHGDLAPASHWYLPLYPLLAAPFVWLGIADPFLPLNLGCLIASVVLTAALCSRLAPDLRGAGLIGAVCFALCELAPPPIRAVWVTPWTSTLATPLTLAALLAFLSWLQRPRALAAFGCGFFGALVGSGRPIDGALILAALGLGALVATGLQRIDRRTCVRSILAYGGGVIVGALPVFGLYLAIWGLHESPYVQSSAQIGFAARLIPLHWVELMISPKPALPVGQGMIATLPFVLTGLLGLASAIVTGRHLRDMVVGGTILGSTLLYLSYRDLHAPGLWDYHNIHYFKWAFGLLGFYSLFLIRDVVRRPAALLWLVPLAALLTCWRATPEPLVTTGRVTGPAAVALDVAPMGVMDAIAVPADGRIDQFYFGAHHLTIGSHLVAPIADFKAFAIPGGVMLQPLRPWPAGRLDIGFEDGIHVRGAPWRGRIILLPALPCWGTDWPRACIEHTMLPPPAIPAGIAISPAAPSADGMAASGWFDPEGNGRWTRGNVAVLRFRPAVHPRGDIVVRLDTSAIAAGTPSPVRFSLEDDRHALGHWQYPDGKPHELVLHVPHGDIPPDGTINLFIDVSNPTPPHDIFPGSDDVRPLGIFVRSVAWDDVHHPE